jgi:hypothetical protein
VSKAAEVLAVASSMVKPTGLSIHEFTRWVHPSAIRTDSWETCGIFNQPEVIACTRLTWLGGQEPAEARDEPQSIETNEGAP